MKSERRHELQTNVLADWLGMQMEAVKPYLPQIAIGLIVILVVAAASYWYVSGNSRATADAWSEYFAAFNEREPQDALADLMTTKSGSPAALWAAQSVGDMNLSQGATLLFSDRTEAEERLKKAEEALKQVEANATDPMLKARAQLSLGKLYEAKLQPEEARKHYELASETAKSTAIAKEAAAHARRMKDQRQVELLAWFAKQTPKRPAPLPGIGGGLPGLPNDLPDRPDLSVPGLNLDDLGTGTGTTPGLSFPPPSDTPPATPGEAGTEPAATPSSDTPSTGTQPTDTPPATSPSPDVPPTESPTNDAAAPGGPATDAPSGDTSSTPANSAEPPSPETNSSSDSTGNADPQ